MFKAITRWLRSKGKPAAERAMPPVVEIRPYIDRDEVTQELLQEDMTLMTNKTTALVRQVRSDLERHEGFREYAYPDPLSQLQARHGKERWGFVPARQILERLGISVADAAKLGHPFTVGHGFTGGVTPDSRMSRLMSERKLEEKVVEMDNVLRNTLPWYKDATDVTKGILINMAFNMGLAGLLKFNNTLRFISEKNYEQAAHNMTLSKWYTQVGARARELVERMRTQQIAASHKVKDL